jgi:cytochrome P450
VVPLLPLLPEIKAFLAKGREVLEARLRKGSSRADIFSHLLAPDPDTGETLTKFQLESNAQLTIVAGTDTTASTMTALFTEFARNPRIQAAVHGELKEAFSSAQEIDVQQLTNLPYLNACINEALRVWPAVPGGGRYCTPPSGITVDGTFIPGNVAVKVSTVMLMKDPRYFVDGEKFIPERWTTRPELVKDKRAFVPFSYGAHVCVGKALAMNEMRLVVGRLIWDYEVKTGKGWSKEKWETGWRDYFTVMMGEACLRFEKREPEKA